MNTPDQRFRLQTQLSQWAGTKAIAGWLAIIAFVLLSAAGVVLILAGKASRVGMLASPLLLAASCLLLRTRAKKRIGEIEAELSS